MTDIFCEKIIEIHIFTSEVSKYTFLQRSALLAMQSAVIPTAIPSVCPSVYHTLVPYPDE